MARNNDRDRGAKRTIKDNRPRGTKKVCIFCKEHVNWVDCKDINLLRRFMSDRGKIRSRRVTGNCAQHQRDVQVAIKTARELALLPYTQRTVNERGPGRTPRAGRRDDMSELREPIEREDLDIDSELEEDGEETEEELGSRQLEESGV